MKKMQMRRCHFSLFVLLGFFSLTSFQEQTILKVVETDRRRKKAFQWRETSQRLQTQSSNHFVCSLSQHPDMSPGARWFKVPSYSLKKTHTHNKTHIRLFFFSFFMSWRGVKTSVWISFSFFKAVERTEPLLAALPGTVRGTETSISLSLSISLFLFLSLSLSPFPLPQHTHPNIHSPHSPSHTLVPPPFPYRVGWCLQCCPFSPTCTRMQTQASV